MPNFTDQTGKIIEVSAPPLRIVSLVPSITELCAYLGLEDRVVGITKFCLYPDRWYRSKTRVGGTKDPDISRILALNTDLVLANKEENTPQSIEALEQAGIPVWVSDIRTFSAALEMIAEVGRLTGKPEESRHLVSCIEQSGGSVDLLPISAVCLIWNNPIMAAGNDTFIHAMMERAGFTNLIGGQPTSRYPVLGTDELQTLAPRVLLLPSEPFPFGETHRAHFMQLLPDTGVITFPGEMISWYGSRMADAIPYLRQLRAGIGLDR